MLKNLSILFYFLLLSTQAFPLTMANFLSSGDGASDTCQLKVAHIGYKHSIHTLNCSDEVLAEEGKAFRISDNFEATEAFSRRVHFWKKIYGLFGIRDYVIHSSEYTELVLASIRVGDERPLHYRPKRILRGQLSKYKKILKKLHRNKGVATDEAQARIVASLQHIEDPMKYKIASESLRIQRGQKEFIESGIDTAIRYLPHIEPYFVEAGIPTELAYIAFVESSFNLKAVSKVGASGVYQIMPFIARKTMILNSKIDERRDPIKSGAMAARLFKENLKLTGNWPLAVTAYNHGPFGIRRAKRSTGSSDLDYIIKNYNRRKFGFASKNFYSEFLAALDTVKSHSKFTAIVPKENRISYQEIALPYTYRIKTILSRYKMTREQFKSLNPDVLRHVANSKNATLPKGFRLKIPSSPKAPLS